MDAMEEDAEKYLFEKMPVPKAVATLAIPTIISQVVTMIYNLADTFFVGQLGDPMMVAAVSLVSALVQSAHGAGESVRPGRQQPDFPDDGGAKPQEHQICIRIQHLGRSGGDASLFPGHLGCARPSAEFSGSQLGYLWLCRRISFLGRGLKPDAD